MSEIDQVRERAIERENGSVSKHVRERASAVKRATERETESKFCESERERASKVQHFR